MTNVIPLFPIVDGDKPMFTPDNVDVAPENSLGRIVRMIFVERGITTDDFIGCYIDYLQETHPDWSRDRVLETMAADRKFLMEPQFMNPETFRRVITAMDFSLGDITGRPSDPLRDAAMVMQVAVAKVLESGGLTLEVWFDALVEAQRNLATQTQATREELAKLRAE